MLIIIYVYYIYTCAVLCCFGNGNSDSLSLCECIAWSKSLFNNITSFTTCAEELPLYKGTVLINSLFSIIGLGNFYSKNYFDGVFELVEGAITVLLIIIYPSWFCKVKEQVKTVISAVLLFLLIICNILEGILMYCSKEFNKPYIPILIISLVLAGVLQYKYGLQCKTFVITISTLITILNTVTNLFLFEFDLKLDGDGCPFTLDDAVDA